MSGAGIINIAVLCAGCVLSSDFIVKYMIAETGDRFNLKLSADLTGSGLIAEGIIGSIFNDRPFIPVVSGGLVADGNRVACVTA